MKRLVIMFAALALLGACADPGGTTTTTVRIGGDPPQSLCGRSYTPETVDRATAVLRAGRRDQRGGWRRMVLISSCFDGSHWTGLVVEEHGKLTALDSTNANWGAGRALAQLVAPGDYLRFHHERTNDIYEATDFQVIRRGVLDGR